MDQVTKVVTSQKYRLNWRDAGKGLIVAMLAAGIAACQTALDPNTLHFNWRFVIGSALAGGFGYIIKNFFESSKVIIKTEEVKPQ